MKKETPADISIKFHGSLHEIMLNSTNDKITQLFNFQGKTIFFLLHSFQWNSILVHRETNTSLMNSFGKSDSFALFGYFSLLRIEAMHGGPICRWSQLLSGYLWGMPWSHQEVCLHLFQ